jgi:predicted permease
VKLWNRILYFGKRRSMERELEEELRAHRAMKYERLCADGMNADEARVAAGRSFGNMTLALEDSRGAWNFAWLESLGQDIRYALRCFRNAPLFSLTVILTIGLALALNTILFTAFNAYVLAPFSVQDPYSLYSISWNTKAVSGRGFSWDEFQHLLQNTQARAISEEPLDNSAFADVLAMRRATVRFNNSNFKGELVSGNYFSMLGVTPEIGRTLVASDATTPGGDAVVVLSHAFWKAKFQRDPSVIGRIVLLQGRPFEIVGVARQGFAGIRYDAPDFWAPITMYSALLDGADLFGPANPHPLELVGRLNRNTTLNQARASLLVSAKQLTAAYAPDDRVIGVSLESNATSFPLTSEVLEGSAPVALAFGLVLLLACANVANMMLARAMARQREIGLRLALGASRPRLIRQLLTEGFVLAIPSAALGICGAMLAAVFGSRAVFAILPPAFAGVFRVAPIHLDWRVFMFVLIAACVSTLGFALVPALQATRGDLVRATRGEFTHRHRVGRLRNALVAVQIMICVMLLICSGILLRGRRQFESVDLALDLHNVIEIDTRQDLHAKAASLLAANLSVESVAAVWRAPLYGNRRGISIEPEQTSSFSSESFNFVSPEYFDVFHLPITKGRNFTVDEARAESPVIIVSEAAGHRLWPGANPIDRTLRIQTPPLSARSSGDKFPGYASARVIGVARDVGGSVIFRLDQIGIYFPAAAAKNTGFALLTRVRGNPDVAQRSLDTTLASEAPGAVTQMIPMAQVLEVRYLPFHIMAWISESLGGLSLALTAIGIYGVIAYLVMQRTKEIGIRVALGGSSRSVIQLILSQSIRIAAVGLGIGALVSLVVARLVASEFAILNTFDVGVYAVSIAIVLAAAALAAAIPARRAAKLDAMTVLRHE